MAQHSETGGPRRVAIVSDWSPPRRGGIEVHMVSLAGHLRRAGVDATIVTTFPGPPEADGVAVDRVPSLLLPRASLAVSPNLVGIATERLAGRYDLVHVHASQVAPFCLAAAIAAIRLDIPVVVTFHSFMGVLPRLLAISERLRGWSNGRVAITAVSSLVAGQITQVLPLLPVSVLPNGFDRSLWSQRHLPGHAPLRIVTALRLQRRKRPYALVDLFVRARALAGEHGSGMTLTIAGDGPEKDGLERHIRRRGCEQAVRIAGWLPPQELSDLYANADLFVMPSTKEAFCIAALEARAAGLPVLGMAKTGMADFIADGITGELAHDDGDMARRLAELSRDRRRLTQLARADDALQRYDWANLTREHISFYRALSARKPAAAHSRT